jgi:ABC-2 type transport system ATP-binding protein
VGLAEDLKGRDGITMVAPFGASLHVSGRDKDALEAAIAPYRTDGALHWEKAQASLEDVFIELMGRARDSRQ